MHSLVPEAGACKLYVCSTNLKKKLHVFHAKNDIVRQCVAGGKINNILAS